MSASPVSQPPALLQRALNLHQRGLLHEAIAVYQDILRLQPDHVDALHLSGVIAAQLNEPRRAVDLMDRALALDAGNAVCLCNRALALQQLQEWNGALDDFNRALSLVPDYAQAYFNRGNLLQVLGRRELALADYDRALGIDAALFVAHANRGVVLEELGHWEAALASYRRALDLQAEPQLYVGYASLLQRSGRLTEALAAYERALAISPNLATAHSDRSVVLLALHRDAEAADSARRAVALDPADPIAHNNLGNALKQLGDLTGALASYERALARNADYAAAYTNRGNVLKDQNRLDESLASHDRALALDPNLAEAHFNRSFVLLLRGDYARGFAEYEWRWRVAHGVSPRDRREYRAPLWLGETSLEGKTILLHSEQGFGDTIQFCRYVPLVARRGARVILQVPQPLERLLSGLPGVAHWLIDDAQPPACDVHCPLLSLPLAFGTTVDTVPAQIPFLQADAATVSEWRERLGPRSRPRVGLVWSGGSGPNPLDLQSAARRRNIPLRLFAGLKDSGIDFYSLQKGEPAEAELESLRAQGWDGPEIIEYGRHLTDFAQTAALIDQLDLVISVDTSTAHLAGAMGVPVWILNRFDSCWRWLHGRSDSPWYPTARLYTQTVAGDWTVPLQRLRADLATFADRSVSLTSCGTP